MEVNKQKESSKYVKGKLIGKGSFGEVHIATLSSEKNNSRPVRYAIKSFKLENTNEKHLQNQTITFKQEIETLVKLSDVHIIKIIDAKRLPKEICIVLEYANGGNLKDYCSKYKDKNKTLLPERLIQYFALQILKGLEYLHNNKNIAHRDIKLENILLHFPERYEVDIDNLNIEDVENHCILKIADLGLAKNFGNTQTVCGTKINMAPEVFKRKPYNYKVDLWSLGTVLFELAFGKIPPMVTLLMNNSIRSYINEDVTISHELLSFMNSLLQFDPEKRIDWNEIKSHDFLNKKVSEFKETKIKKEEFISVVYRQKIPDEEKKKKKKKKILLK